MTNRVPVSYAVKVVEHTVCVPQHIGPDISMAIPSQITLFHFEIPTKAVPTVVVTARNVALCLCNFRESHVKLDKNI